MDVGTFCQRCVDNMGEESDHVQLVALTDALQASAGRACRAAPLEWGSSRAAGAVAHAAADIRSAARVATPRAGGGACLCPLGSASCQRDAPALHCHIRRCLCGWCTSTAAWPPAAATAATATARCAACLRAAAVWAANVHRCGPEGSSMPACACNPGCRPTRAALSGILHEPLCPAFP